MLTTFDIWIEGYSITGDSSEARLIASGAEGRDFRDACCEFAKTKEAKDLGSFNSESLSFWGCRLFDNEEDARASFG